MTGREALLYLHWLGIALCKHSLCFETGTCPPLAPGASAGCLCPAPMVEDITSSEQCQQLLPPTLNPCLGRVLSGLIFKVSKSVELC